ncbi:MAG: hypothetical protein WCA35_09060, partial [Kovacikia sp.]
LPACVKVIITSREKFSFLPIHLPCLPQDDGLRLIKQQAEERGISLSEEDSKLLYDRTGGIPLAMVYAVGQISSGNFLDAVLKRLASATGDPARFIFESAVREMNGQPPHKLLMALAIFPDPPTQTTVVEIAGLTAIPDAVNDGWARLYQLSFASLNQRSGRYEMLSLTREYALAELATNPGFERQARSRWVSWYLDFAQRYAGDDWEHWIHFSKLEEEEGNLREILIWCKNQDDYETVRDLWLLLNNYANLYGYWVDRLDWLEWLIEQSKLRVEWATFVKMVIRKSWLLIRMCSDENLQEANELLMQAWNLRSHADLHVQADLAESIARLQIRQKNFQDACFWLDREENLVIEANLEEHLHVRYFIPILYHRAEIFHLEGNYEQAKCFFREVLSNAERIKWYRVINSAQNWLADIAIEQGDRDTSLRLLTEGLTVAETSKNQRRLARYQRSFARWQKKWGSLDTARQWGTTAMNGFERLSMTREKDEMQSFLNRLG